MNSVGRMLRPGMRAYLIPLLSGVALTVSAFLPWVRIGDISMQGIPDVPALWVAGLGVLAAGLAALSMITRRNSRHPLLVINFRLRIADTEDKLRPRLAEPAFHAGVD